MPLFCPSLRFGVVGRRWILGDKIIPRETLPAKSAAFARSIRTRYPKTADAIFQYLVNKANEYDKEGHQTSGYSECRMLWDTQKDQEMTYVQKMAYYLEANGDMRMEKDSLKHAFEVDGFHPCELFEMSTYETVCQELKEADKDIEKQPACAEGHSRRAAAMLQLGNLQEAKLSYSKAWGLEPSNAKIKADLEHVLSEIAGMKVMLPSRH